MKACKGIWSSLDTITSSLQFSRHPDLVIRNKMADSNHLCDTRDDGGTVKLLSEQLDKLRDANRITMEEIREKGRIIESLVDQRDGLLYEVFR